MKESIKNKIDKLKEFIKVHPYIYGLILSLFISLFASFFFFSSVSPIFSGAKDFSYDVGSVDSNYFMYTGKRILAGDLPYIDFFDHKGVLVFYFNALGMLLGGKIGVFILNFIITFITCFNITIAAKELFDNPLDITLVSLLFFVCLAATEGGNQNGFMSLPFVPLPLAFYLRAIRLQNKDQENNRKKIRLYYLLGSLLAGLEIGIAFNVRPSDGVVCAALFVAYFVMWIKHRYKWDLIFNALAAILGFAIPVAIIWSAAYVSGYLDAMIDANFVQSSKYAFGFTSSLTIFSQVLIVLWTSFALFFMIRLLVKGKKEHKDLALLFITLTSVNAIPNFIYAKYVQYFFTAFPYMVLLLATIIRLYPLKKKEHKKPFMLDKIVIYFSAIFPLIGGVGTTSFYYSGAVNQYSYKYSQGIKNEIIDTIPKEAFNKDNNVYFLNVNAAALLWFNDNTDCAYQSYQSWHSAFDNNVEGAVYDYLVTYKPEFIVRGKNGEGLEKPYSFIKFIEGNYKDITPTNIDNEITIYQINI